MTVHATVAWLFVVSLAALALRLSVLDRTNIDILNYSLPWLEQLRRQGFWKAIAHPFSEVSYPPPYTYLMGLANVLLPYETDGKSVMKSIPILFDFMAAGLMFSVANLRWGAGWQRIVAYSLFLFAPTVLLNGAYWGQSDIIYSTFIIASIYAVLRGSGLLAMIFFGLSFSLKLQSIWLGPFILLLLLRGRIRDWHAVIPPFIYFILSAPTLIAGRSAFEVMTIYVTQANHN